MYPVARQFPPTAIRAMLDGHYTRPLAPIAPGKNPNPRTPEGHCLVTVGLRAVGLEVARSPSAAFLACALWAYQHNRVAEFNTINDQQCVLVAYYHNPQFRAAIGGLVAGLDALITAFDRGYLLTRHTLAAALTEELPEEPDETANAVAAFLAERTLVTA